MSLARIPVSLKVPARIAAIFWAIKLLTTAFGESTSDYLVHNVNPYLAVIGGFLVFVVAMTLQLRTDRYVPWVYWLAVSMVALFGTMAADVLHIEFRVPYPVSSMLFAIALVAVFWSWSRTEGTLSIHSITTTRRELFYWAAVLATFAMGTALGDLAAYTLNLGFLTAGILFAVLFALPGLAYYTLRAGVSHSIYFAAMGVTGIFVALFLLLARRRELPDSRIRPTLAVSSVVNLVFGYVLVLAFDND